MKKFFNRFYVGKAKKLKPARPTMVGIQRRFLVMLYINFICTSLWKYRHHATARHLHSHLHLCHTWCLCFEEGWEEGFSLVDDHFSLSVQMSIINQIPINVQRKDLIPKVDCSNLWDHRFKPKEV